MNNETELKPCAHCGKNEWLITSAMGEVWGYCNEKTNGCGLVIHSKHNTKASVIEAINTRPIEDALNARIAELEQQLAEAKRENLRQRVEDIRNNWFYENEFNDSLMEAFYLDVKPKFNPFNQEHTDKIIADWLITQGVEGVKE
jgi:hypothetical protein